MTCTREWEWVKGQLEDLEDRSEEGRIYSALLDYTLFLSVMRHRELVTINFLLVIVAQSRWLLRQSAASSKYILVTILFVIAGQTPYSEFRVSLVGAAKRDEGIVPLNLRRRVWFLSLPCLLLSGDESVAKHYRKLHWSFDQTRVDRFREQQ